MTDTSHRFANARDAAYFAKEAALIGARQAFSRPSSAASQSQRPNTSVLQGSWYGAHNKPTPPPLPTTSSSSVPLSSSASASVQRTDSLPSLQSPSASDTQIKSPSPSNLAAGAAAFRTREVKEKIPEPTIQNSTDILRPGVSRLGHVASPPTNLAGPNRIAQPPSSNGASATISSPKTRPRKPSKPVQLEGRTPRPTLSIDTPKAPSGAFIKAATSSPEIHSPKPIRPTSTAASFEAATARQQKQQQSTSDNANASSTESTSLATAVLPASVEDPEKKPSQPPPSMPMPPPQRRSQNTNGTTTTFPVYYARPANARTVSQSSLASLQDESQRIDALANAIVGAHLASSRASSPAKSPIPGWGRQGERTPAGGGPFKGYNPDSRTPSPAKRMRHTLRKTPQPEPEEDPNPRRARGPFHFRQHPHKHHEGDRKRWRDEISHEERKRYEGVWAANRDVYMRFTDGELLSPLAMEKIKGQVSGLVVRDIWSRSRLPQHELEEIWDLVDRQKLGRLDREEFVVGLWLVDQRLKGRKFPSKVGNSVWQSVRGIYGLKVPKRKD